MNLRLNRRRFLNVTQGTIAAGAASTLIEPRAATAQETSPTTPLPITVVNTGGPLARCFQELIDRKGYFDQLGLKVTTIDVSDSTKIIGSLIGGDTDVCIISGLSQTFPAMEKGAPLKLLAEASALAPISLFSSKPEIKTLSDLQGKVIGTGAVGAVLQQLAVALLQKRGIDVSKIRFVNIGSTSDILKAVIAGVVDAGTVNVDAYDSAKAHNIHPIADFFVDLAEYPYQGSFATVSSIKTKRLQIIRVLAAYAKLYRFIQAPNSRDEYVAAYMAATGGKASAGKTQWQFIQKYKPYAENLILPDSSIRYLQQINIRTGVQTAVLPSRQVADMSLAAAAIKLIS